MLRRLLPRLRSFFFLTVLAAALITGERMLNTDSDLGRHLTLGQYILSSARIPTHDILSFTKAGASRPPYEWLAQVLFALANRLLGLDGVVLLASALIAAAFLVVYLDGISRSAAPLLSFALAAWAAVASGVHWLARPHLFSFLAFALWLFGLERLRTSPRPRWWLLPILMLVWSNLHGGFIFGFLAWAAYLGGWFITRLRGSADRIHGIRLVTVGITSAVASVLTPGLWHNWAAVLNNQNPYIIGHTVETMPLHLSTPGVWPFIFLLVLAVLAAFLRRFRVRPEHLILLAGLAFLAIVVVRNIPLFAIASAPILAEWLSASLSPITIWRRVEARFVELDAALRGSLFLPLALVVVVAAFCYRDLTRREPVFAFRSDVFPADAASWLVDHPQPGPMFNDFNWGGYLLYRLWPQQKVFIDSQSDFYGEGLTRQAAEIVNAQPGWQSALDGYAVNLIFLPRTRALAAAAASDPHWRVAYEDPVAIILVRR